ncbi:MAG: VOC family protein [Salibacteraceae bacterium]
MKKVTGIGGVFFKTKNPEETKKWYSKHLGIESGAYGGQFLWRAARGNDKLRTTAWSPMEASTDYFDPGDQDFMINYRVHDLDSLLSELKNDGVMVIDGPVEYEYGRFAWILDPDGRKVELWEPIDLPLIQPPHNEAE